MDKFVIPPKDSESGQYTWDQGIYVPMRGTDRVMTLRQLIALVATAAHIAGSQSTKGLGLNLSKEERAEEYCKEQGFI